MSRKHYIEIATVLAQHGASETLLFDMAKIFESDNLGAAWLIRKLQLSDLLKQPKRLYELCRKNSRNYFGR
jgi:hypothetical protein